MDTGVAELVSFFQALKGGSLFLLALVLIGLPLIVVGVAYQRIVNKRFQSASKATQENFETIAADLRKRALEVKKHDEGLRKHDLDVNERDELKGFVKDANAELTEEPQHPQQQQVLKGSQRALKESVSQIITVGLKDSQNRMLQTDFKGALHLNDHIVESGDIVFRHAPQQTLRSGCTPIGTLRSCSRGV
jgi:hypothetical protein